MKPGKTTVIVIVNALLWAVAMIISSQILKDTAYAQKMLYLLLALSTGSILLLEGSRKSIHDEWECLRRLFGAREE